jgi:Zn-dependent membrane protease YugP
MLYFDMNYMLWVMIPTMIISFGAQMYLKSAYSKWSKVRNSYGMTGAEVAQRILKNSSLARVGVDGPQRSGAFAAGISLERVGGELTDHYDPRTHTVRMSDSTAHQPSVVAMAVVAHELGHAQQHEENSPLITMRNILLPAVRFSPQLAYGMILIGLLMNITGLLWLGIIFFGLTVLFTVLTLPVEFDASRRGLILLREANLLQTSEDEQGSRQVLTAAGLTYVAAAVTALLQLLYYVSLATRRD